MLFSDFIANRASQPNEFAPLDFLYFLWISLDLGINSLNVCFIESNIVCNLPIS